MVRYVMGIDDGSMTEYPDWTLLKVDDSQIDPAEVVASSMGYATDLPYSDYFDKYDVEFIDASDNYDESDIYDLEDELPRLFRTGFDPVKYAKYKYGIKLGKKDIYYTTDLYEMFD